MSRVGLGRLPHRVLFILPLIPLLAFGLVPLAIMIVPALTQLAWSDALSEQRTRTLLIRTLALGFSSALGASLIGGVIGYRLGTQDWRGKNIVRALLVLPLALPPYLHAIAWTTFLRPNGTAAHLISQSLGFGSSDISDALYSFIGAVLVFVIAYFPIPMLFTEKSLVLCPKSLAETARVFGGGRWQVFALAHWPFMRTALASSTMIVLLMAVSELGVPTILKVQVFNFEVFTQLAAFNDIASAALLCLPLIAVGLIAISAERTLHREDRSVGDTYDLGASAASFRTTFFNNLWLMLLFTLLFGLPFGSVAATVDVEAFQRMTVIAGQPAMNTIVYGVGAAGLATVAALCSGSVSRSKSRWGDRVTDALLGCGFAVPSTIIALALLATYNRPAIAHWISPTVLVIAALIVKYQIVAHRIVGTSLSQIQLDLLEAARIDGATGWQVVVHIIFPLIRTALFASICVMFIISAGEVGSTILLHPPGGETLPIVLYAIEANSPRSYVAAMTLLQAFLILVPVLAMTILLVASKNRFS